MGPLLLLPVAAVAVLAVVLSRPETAAIDGAVPSPQAKSSSLAETYGCALYNQLLEVDDAITDHKDNFLVIADRHAPQKYAQVWLSQDHYFADYEVSSLFYEFKEPQKRQFWPESVQTVLQKEGFRLRDSIHGNYQRSVLLPRPGALKEIAFSMLRVMEQGFAVKAEDFELNVRGHMAPALKAGEPCRELSPKQQVRAPMPADGGEQGYEAVYDASLSNRLHVLETAPAKTMFHVLLSADGSLGKTVRLSGLGGSNQLSIEVPVTDDPARLAVLRDWKFDLDHSKTGFYAKSVHLKSAASYWTVGDHMLELAYKLYGAKIGQARLSPLFSDGKTPAADSFELLEQNAYSDYSPP